MKIIDRYKQRSTFTSGNPVDTAEASWGALMASHKISAEESARLLKVLGRTPTMAEVGVFSAMWSEHCSYKSSRIHLRRLPTIAPHVVVGPGENAGVVRLDGPLCVAFKMESHNHPSYIEPYQGAATGVGGILRDVFCMGARPVAVADSLRFGELSFPRTKYLVEHVTRGVGDYGNCVGIPNLCGSISWNKSYNGNCLVNAMTVGFVLEDQIFKGAAPGVGNLVVYVGSATGRDGVQGAVMASGIFAGDSSQEKSAIQVGDPFTEKLLLEATLEILSQNLVVGIQDMGAAGLTSSSFEMAGRAGSGIFMDLNLVPLRAQRMSAYEIMLSESQERMLMVVEPNKWPALAKILEKWELPHQAIGVVTDTGRVEVAYDGKIEVDIPVDSLTGASPLYNRPQQKRPAATAAQLQEEERKIQDYMGKTPWTKVLTEVLFLHGNKEPIYKQYDQHIGCRSVSGPYHGGAGVLWVQEYQGYHPREPYMGIGIATSCDETVVGVDPKNGAALAVLRAARALTACGATPLALTDCLNYGNPEQPEIMWEISEGIDGIAEACRRLDIPVVSGNVSLYNDTDGQAILPTPMIGAVGKIKDVRQSPPARIFSLSAASEPIFLLKGISAKGALRGSLVEQIALRSNPSVHEAVPLRGAGGLPEIDWDLELLLMEQLHSWIDSGIVAACRDVGRGGALTTAIKMLAVFPENVDFTIPADLSPSFLFAEHFGGYLLQFKKSQDVPSLLKNVSARIHLQEFLKIEAGSGCLKNSVFSMSCTALQCASQEALHFLGATGHV